MANEVVLINGVTKREHNGNFIYTFPIATITAIVNEAAYSVLITDDARSVINANFVDVTEKFGTTDIESYIDELAVRGFFFDSERVVADMQAIVDAKFAAGTGVVETSYESAMRSETKTQTELLIEIRDLLKSIAE